MIPELGIIEGFYGPRWSWAERTSLMEALADHGYRFYLYAPKGDRFLRRQWMEPHPPQEADQLRGFARRCAERNVRFGIGLSPFEVFNQFDTAVKAALARKLTWLRELEIVDLAILFDDMRGTTAGLALKQVEILHWIRDQQPGLQLTVCPTYYSDDPVLDRVFGQRSDNYLETLGQHLDPAIRVFWTGEEVCSREISPGHLQRISGLLRRKPVLWDNYPVNDGPRMSNHLHLRAFTGRPAANAEFLSGHAINPALQPFLTRLPALSLPACYREGTRYQYGLTLQRLALELLGEALGAQLLDDLLLLQDSGLQRLSDDTLARLETTYGAFNHPAATEILRWLREEYHVSAEEVETQ